jgi:ribonucleotide reductase alpha subunit
MKITRRFTQPNTDVFATVEYERRTSRISNPDGKVVFEMTDAEIPKAWSQLATDIMVSKYFRKAGVPQLAANGTPLTDTEGRPVKGPEKSVRQVIHRLAGCWRHWGESHGYFDTAEDAQAFYDELAHMMLHQMVAPNSPQWFNTGLNWAYGITGPAQGHFYCDPTTGELTRGADAYTHPQPHACQPFRAPVVTPAGPVPIGKIVKDKLIGLEVLDGTDEGNGTTTVVAVKENGERPVFRVVLDGGATVEATGDHLVYCLTSDGHTGRWVRLDALDRGMELLQSVRDREAERALAHSPLAATFGGSAVAEVTDAQTIRRLRPARIRRIEPLGTQPVFDIQTASGQYLSNGVIVHNCFIQSVKDDLVGEGGIMDLWTREARLFKYGSGTGSNFSKVRAENERLSGGGKSSGLMSFLKIGDRAAGAIKSGGTTRRAAKMVCLDLDHPDIEAFVNWKVREELKVACLAEGIKHIPGDQQELAKRLGLKLDLDFNGEAYYTVSGQNSNNSVRIPDAFFKAVEADGDWHLYNRTDGKVAKTLKARELWDAIAFAAWRCADPGVQYDTTINDWHTCPKSGRINASNPCVTGDTRVLTPGGIWRRIDQMIHLPARVVTNLDAQEIHVTEGSFPTGTKDVFELRTAGGYTLKLTGDHKVWTRSRGWVEAQHLTTADELRLPSRPAAVHAIGEPQDARFFQLLGLFLSDANGSASALKLDAALAGTSEAPTFARYVADTWGDAAFSESGGGTAVAEASPITHRRLLSRVKAFVRTDLASGGKASRLGDEAFTAGLAAQKHLLRGLFTADGVVANNTLELRHASAGLLQDVQLVLLGFGVQSLVDDHALRVDPGSLRAFGKHVGLLPGRKLEQLGEAISVAIARPESAGNYDRFAGLSPLGKQQVFDLTEPNTHSFVAGGLTVHNCSEYMFLDDTACNLASLNALTFFDAETKAFDVEAFKHGVRIWTIVLEISVLMASFPSEEIATLSYKFRTLGLGYANLGAMLMQAGIAYDSDKGRAICAAVSAVLTGESYATSALMARELGAFPGYAENGADMLRVIRNHRRAAYDVAHSPDAAGRLGTYEKLDIHPVGIDAGQFTHSDPLANHDLLAAARECWDRALDLGVAHGYRNAQTTVIAPTGTIGLLMDCDTTGVEPDFALVKFKKLSGGGYFKIANQSLRTRSTTSCST